MTARRTGRRQRATCRAGGLVVVRARDAKARLALAQRLGGVAPLLIADDPELAARIGAAGIHLPQARMREAAHWRAAHPDWIITSSAHLLRALMQARELDAVFLSPVFATGSHKDAKPCRPPAPPSSRRMPWCRFMPWAGSRRATPCCWDRPLAASRRSPRCCETGRVTVTQSTGL